MLGTKGYEAGTMLGLSIVVTESSPLALQKTVAHLRLTLLAGV